MGVLAPDTATARHGIDAIRAEWDLAPQPSEHELIAHLRATQVAPSGSREWGGPSHHEAGDVDAALPHADVRLDRTYTTAYIAHAPLETRAALAEWDGGRLTVWTGTQRPFGVRDELAAALDVPQDTVRVIVPDTGAGYGGKHTGEAALEAARLSRVSGRPVSVAWTRREEFTWAYVRPAAVIDVRSGATNGGDLTAWEFTNINAGDAGILCPYEIPNQRIEFRPADSPLRQGSYRALAATANHFARESHLDELAHQVGADPLALRLRHLRDDRLAAVFQAAAERAGLGRTPRDPGHGIGIAGGVEKDARVATCVEVRADADGQVEIVRVVTAFDCGAIVNPDGLVNQIEGATVMGLGGALFEAIHFEDGQILNPSLSTYRVPRFTDVPPIDVILIDHRDVAPAGAGETPIVAVAPAVANAIFDADGAPPPLDAAHPRRTRAVGRRGLTEGVRGAPGPAGLASVRARRVPHHHRAVPDPLRRTVAYHDSGGAARCDRRRRLQPLRPARRRRADRPVDRLWHRRDVARSVGRDPARGRELRGLAVVVHLPRGRSGAVPVHARDPDAPGAGRREDPVLGDRRSGQGRTEQHALRYDACERRVHGRGGGRPRDPRGTSAITGTSLQGEHGPRGAGLAAGRTRGRRAGGLRHRDEQLRGRSARVHGEPARRARTLRPLPRHRSSSTRAGSPRTHGSSARASPGTRTGPSPRSCERWRHSPTA